MAVYSARQSSYSDGDTITAAHTNDEFNAILAAFNVSTGHTHDGSTAGDGGPISNLFSNALVFGTNADTDIAITFNANSNDGVLTWMEDEDYFQFSDDILLTTTEKLQFRDTAIYINSSTDGQLDLVADTEIQIAATTVDINGNVDVSGTLTVAGAVDFGDAALSNVGAVQLDSIAGDGDTNTSITFSGSDVITITAGGDAQFTFNNGSIVPSVDDDIDLGTSSLEFKDAFFDGTVTTDALVADTADINGGTIDGAIIGGSSAAAITGTAITGTSFVIGSANISEAELETIDGVTAGTVAASKAVVVDSNKDIGSFRNVTATTFVGNIDAVDGDFDGTLETDALSINGTTVTSTAAELNLLDGVSGLVQADFTKLAAVDSTATELNIVDGDTSATSTTVADADRVVLNDNGTMVQVAVTDLAAYFDDEITAMPNLTSVGTLTTLTVDNIIVNGTTIGHTSDTDLITLANGSATIAGDLSVTGTLDVGDSNITNIGSIALDTITNDGTDITLDSSGEIHLDADGGIIRFKDAGTAIGTFENVSSDFIIKSSISDQDLIFKGNDGGSGITALTLDMSAAGAATFNSTVTANAGVVVDNITIDGTEIDLSSGNLTIDVAGDINLDAGGSDISLQGSGAEYGKFNLSGNSLNIHSSISDGDIVFKGNDGGSSITALTLDMSDAGTATFNHDVILGDESEIKLGASGDLRIYHDNAHSYVQDDGSGQLRIKSNGNAITLVTGAGNDFLVNAVVGGAVELYHNTAKKVETTSSGIDVTGLVEFDSLSGTGSVAITDIADEDDMTSNSATKLSTQQSIKAYADTKAGKGFAVAMAIAL